MVKKSFKSLSAVVIAIIAISSATGFAQDAKPEGLQFTFGVGGWAYGTKIQSVTKDKTGDWIDYRIRPEFALTDGETTFKMRFEIDSIYGSNANSETTNAMPVNADTRNIEVAYAYFQSKMKAIPGVTLIVGIAPDVVRVPFIFSDNAPLVALQFATGPAKINLAYVKLYEGSLTNESLNDDSQMGWINAEVKTDAVRVNPFFGYLKVDEGAALTSVDYSSGFYKAMSSDSTAFITGIDADADLGAIKIDATVEYGKGKNKATDVKYSGYAADLGISMKVDIVKITAFGTLVSGDKDSATGDKTRTSFTDFYLDNGHAAVMGRRMFLFERAYTCILSGSVAGKAGTDQGSATKKNGLLMAGLQAEAKMNDVRLKFQTAYAQLDKVASGEDKDLGYEFDLGAYYNFNKRTTVYTELAYIIAGNAFDTALSKAENPYAIIVGSTFKM